MYYFLSSPIIIIGHPTRGITGIINPAETGNVVMMALVDARHSQMDVVAATEGAQPPHQAVDGAPKGAGEAPRGHGAPEPRGSRG